MDSKIKKKYQNQGTMTRDCVTMEIKAEEGVICSTLDQTGVEAISPTKDLVRHADEREQSLKLRKDGHVQLYLLWHIAVMSGKMLKYIFVMIVLVCFTKCE